MRETLNISWRAVWVWWVGYYLLVVGLRWSVGWWILGWLAGGLFAWGFVLIDKLVYAYMLRPEDGISLELRDLMSREEWRGVWNHLRSEAWMQRPMMGLSVVFLAVWVPLSLLLITSSPSWFAKGLVMGIGLRAMVEVVLGWNRLPEIKRRFFWQIKREVPDDEARVVLGVFIGVFVGLTLLV